MSTLYSPFCSQMASISGAVTSREALCSVGGVTVGLGILRPPKRAGREMSSLPMSLMSVLPVRAGRSCCLIASSRAQGSVPHHVCVLFYQ